MAAGGWDAVRIGSWRSSSISVSTQSVAAHVVDEQLSPQIAALLRQAGPGRRGGRRLARLIGRSDMFIFEIACSEHRP
jgi:hypothetical protein